jgi:glycerophosphoryl diester phosphodiesterase
MRRQKVMQRKAIFLSSLLIVVFLAGLNLPASGEGQLDKIVIAHRGASGYLPEHTLESYVMAYALGADFIETDLALTKDGIFVCIHDIYLEYTTNVREVFPDRARKDRHWYVVDFSLEEIKHLNVHERARANGIAYFPSRFPLRFSKFEIPTFREMIELIQGLNKSTGGNVGIYPEIKKPGWHAQQGLQMEEALLEILNQYGYKGRDAKIFIQCFEVEPLKKLRFELGTDLPLVLLTWEKNWNYGGDVKPFSAKLTEDILDEIAIYADGIGPNKDRIEVNPAIVQWAHERGLLVHTWTMRADALPVQYQTFDEELLQFYIIYKVDGLFTDFTDRTAQFLHSWSSPKK